ncbi:MAG: class I SAM-dependent methyltransferase [Verrucomicrobiales bacterium]
MPEPQYIAADWYDSPHYYDLIFDQDTAVEADFVEAAWEKHSAIQGLPKQLRILEPACGSGRMMKELASRGHRVTGFDRNEKMLKAARERFESANCRGTLERASLEEFSLKGKFDFAHCLVSTFKYILTEEGAVSHLQCVANHLRPGGIYLLGIHLTDYSRENCEHERWTGSNAGVHVVCNTRTWPPDRRTRLEKLRNRLRVRHDDDPKERLLETVWNCRTYSASEFFRTIAKVPALTPVAFYNFHHDIKRPLLQARRQLSNDVVFVLQNTSN